MNYPKSFLSIIVCATLIGSSTVARPVKKKKMSLRKQTRKTSSVRPVKNVSVKASKWFTLGLELGKQTVAQMPQSLNETLGNSPKEVHDLGTSIFSGTPGTEDYDKNYAQWKEFHKGFKQGLSTFVPLKENDLTSRQKNLIMKIGQMSSDYWIKANDHNEFIKEFQAKMMDFQNELLLLIPLDQLGNQAGKAHGQKSCQFIIDKAYGHEITAEMKDEYDKLVETFFSILDSYNEAEKKEVLHHYFRGIEETFKECNIDEILKDTPQEKADELKKEYQAALKGVQESLASVDTQ